MTNGHFENVAERLDALLDANTDERGEVFNVILHRAIGSLAGDLVASLNRFELLFATNMAF